MSGNTHGSKRDSVLVAHIDHPLSVDVGQRAATAFSVVSYTIPEIKYINAACMCLCANYVTVTARPAAISLLFSVDRVVDIS